jgi:hypothetical protein
VASAIGPGTDTWLTVTSPEIIRLLGVRAGTLSGVLDTQPECQRRDHFNRLFQHLLSPAVANGYAERLVSNLWKKQRGVNLLLR